MSDSKNAIHGPDGHAPDLNPGTTPIHALLDYGESARQKISKGSLAFDGGKMDEGFQLAADLHAISDKVGKMVAAAMDQAKGRPDLAKAVHDYYTAEEKFILNGVPNGNMEKAVSEKLRAHLDDAEKALAQQMKLAGVK